MKMIFNRKMGFLFLVMFFSFWIGWIPVWADSFNVVFDSNGGNKINSITVTCGQALPVLATPTRSGYTFQGWVNDSNKYVNSGDVITNCNSQGNVNFTLKLKATWKETCDEQCKICTEFKNRNMNNYHQTYGVSIDYDATYKEFIIKMNGSNGWFKYDANYNSRRFYVSKIEYVDMNPSNLKDNGVRQVFTNPTDFVNIFQIPRGSQIGKGSTLKFVNPISVPTRFKVYLSPNGFSDVLLEQKCGRDSSFYIMLTYDYFGDEVIHMRTSQYVLTTPKAVTTGLIDCSSVNISNPKSFEEHFCHDKIAAENAGVQYVSFDGNAYANAVSKNANVTYFEVDGRQAVEFKCDPFLPLKDDLTKKKESTDGLSDEEKAIIEDKYYYTNTSYLLGRVSHDYVVDHYLYNYGGQKVDSNGKPTGEAANPKGVVKEDIVCKVTCNEVVAVEYGSPVASKAGLCFEYKVKVTSRVNCKSEYPNQPKISQSYCTPSPGCNHGSGFYDSGAGPNEEFDSCISACDGGKYTTKCSNKCYDEVYNNGVSSLKSSSRFDFNDLVATKVDYFTNNTITTSKIADKCEGTYTHDYDKISIYGGSVIWKPSDTFGRWYCEHNAASLDWACLKTVEEGGGIASVCGCSATCRWNGCEGNVYLNPGEADKDEEKNVKKYEEAIKICESYSKCSTSQAEFSISASYTHDGGKKETIYYPYSTNNDGKLTDTIRYNGGQVSCPTGSAPYTTILQSRGCYECNQKDVDSEASSSREYLTEWGFPGTWINKKNGKISYQPMVGWLKVDNKFCVPFEVDNTNQKWWNAYYIHQMKDGTDTYAMSSNEINEKNGSRDNRNYDAMKVDFTEQDRSSLTYNINAHAKRFGMFGWNIDISCFYATNDNFPSIDSSKSTTGNTTPTVVNDDSEFIIRSIDLTNMFPDDGGSSITSSDQTGRAPGFNWTVYAASDKIENYRSNPYAYRSWVQKMGYDIYSDEYLDYDIELTKDKIAALKKNNIQNKNFNKSTLEPDSNGVVNYKSDLFRSGNAILGDDNYPTLMALKCNNMKNYHSNDCFTPEGN